MEISSSIERRAHPLVDPLVAAADQDHARPLAALAHQRLVPDASLGREQDGGRPGALGLELFDRGEERLRFHDHAGAAAVGGVVRDPVPVEGPGAQVVDADVEHPALAGAVDDALLERRVEERGENRDDVDPHQQTTSRSVFRAGDSLG